MSVDSLKKRTSKALVWNAIDKAGFQVVALAVGIITARLLSPRDFGLMGALAIFVAISNILVESGFTSALVRRPNNSDKEYGAIFYFHLLLSILIYILLYISAPLIASFFNMPELESLSRFLFLAIIINSLGIVQNIVLTKSLSFKLMSAINLTSALVAGVVAVILVLFGFDYWALAWQLFLQSFVRVFLMWIFGKRFSFNPDFQVIREVFSFSIFLLLTSLGTTIVKNIYNVIIGRLFSAEQLGYYSQANKFQQIPSTVISSTQVGVAYPVLAKLNSEPTRQLFYFRKIIRITSFLIFPVMMGLLSITNELVTIVLTDKWLPAVPYFQLLVVAAIIAPFHSLNLNFLTVKGYSKLNFRLELIRNTLIIISLLFCYRDIKWMMIGFSTASVLSYVCDLFLVREKSGYKVKEQLQDIAPYAIISGLMFLLVKAVGMLPLGFYTTVGLQIIAACCFYFISLKMLGSQVLKNIFDMWIKQKRN